MPASPGRVIRIWLSLRAFNLLVQSGIMPGAYILVNPDVSGAIGKIVLTRLCSMGIFPIYPIGIWANETFTQSDRAVYLY